MKPYNQESNILIHPYLIEKCCPYMGLFFLSFWGERERKRKREKREREIEKKYMPCLSDRRKMKSKKKICNIDAISIFFVRYSPVESGGESENLIHNIYLKANLSLFNIQLSTILRSLSFSRSKKVLCDLYSDIKCSLNNLKLKYCILYKHNNILLEQVFVLICL